VGVCRKHLATERVEQDATSGLDPYPRKGKQVALGVARLHAVECREVRPPEVTNDMRDEALDPWRLLPAEAGVLDDGSELSLWRAQHAVPSRVPQAQPIVDPVEAVVRGHLREQDEHNLVERVGLVPVRRRPVGVVQDLRGAERAPS
jgi:hypothetical protein